MYSFIILLGLATLAASSPAAVPQGFDFDALEDVPPAPAPVIAVGVASQVVTVNRGSLIAAATSAELHSAIPTAGAVKFKRQTSSTCTGGNAEAAGSGPVPSPDTAEAFVAYAPFGTTAQQAPAPANYINTFTNLNGSSNAYGYLGFSTVTSYDTALCAKKCDAIFGCSSFNIYYERDPAVTPGTGSNCNDPASTTQIKCAFWSSTIDASTATNVGQYRANFHVVIAGSNGYSKQVVYTPPGYKPISYIGNAAIQSPPGCNGQDTYLGYKLFNDGTFDIQRCAAACTAQAGYEAAHPPAAPAKPKYCSFFNTYILLKNDAPLAQYCSLYSQPWTAKEATNVGQYDDKGNHYTISTSYISNNVTNPGTCYSRNGGTLCPEGIQDGTCTLATLSDSVKGCYCAPDVSGLQFSLQLLENSCEAYQKCVTNTDCEYGSVCLQASDCCGYNLCFKSSVCSATKQRRNMFERRADNSPLSSDGFARLVGSGSGSS